MSIKKFLIFIIVFINVALMYGNEITIKSFKLITYSPIDKIDVFGETCALLKVKPNFEDELQFDVGKKLAHPYEKNAKGEYWIYLSQGENYLEIYIDNVLVNKKEFLKNQIKSNAVYEMVIECINSTTIIANENHVETNKDVYLHKILPLAICLNGGLSEMGMFATHIGSYNHNPIQTGFNIKLGVRKPLTDFFYLPEFLPIIAQVGLGYRGHYGKGFFSQDLSIITLNIDALYSIDEFVDIPIVDVSPFIGFKYDAQIYETYFVNVVGLQLGSIISYNLSELILEDLNVELSIGQTFDFALSSRISNVFLANLNINLGLSYEINKSIFKNKNTGYRPKYINE